MELKISNERENKLLGRREIEAVVTYAGKTPAKDEIKVELCKKLNLNPDTTMIMNVRQEYGTMVSDVVAYAYSDKESMPVVKEKKKAQDEKKETGRGAAEPAADSK